MIYTSNFSKNGKNKNAISIAIYPPKWFNGQELLLLFPDYLLFLHYKKYHDVDYYKNIYNNMLSKLNAFEMYELYNLEQKILLCYESSNSFCHRHLVREWFNYNGIECKEI